MPMSSLVYLVLGLASFVALGLLPNLLERA